jgi:hypothetical protein
MHLNNHKIGQGIRLCFMLIASFFLANQLFAQAPVKVITGNIIGNVTWYLDTVYLLQGKCYVKNGSVLNINAGTIIKGDASIPGSVLIVTRGAKINAIGTQWQPIVFTSSAPAGSRASGQWGGLVIAGRGRINAPGAQALFEGGNLVNPDGSLDDDKYGGADNNSNSGTLKYVRIEYAGYDFAQDNELNSLTLGGVGSGTTIDYVQCSYGVDDAFEFFGGNVNARHLVAYRTRDDDFDSDFGFSGNVQFALSIRDSHIADTLSGSNCIESDNDAAGSGNKPYTSGVFCNVTAIGPKETASSTISQYFRRALHIRRNSRLSVYNSAFCGYPTGLKLDGDSVHVACDNNLAAFAHNYIAGCPIQLDSASGALWGITNYVTNQNAGNGFLANCSDLQLADAFNDTLPNALPNIGSPLLNAASFAYPNLAVSSITPVTYVGAFGDTDWTIGWTSWNPQNEPYLNGYGEPANIANTQSQVDLVFPNPVNSTLQIQGQHKASNVVVCYDACGRVMYKSSYGDSKINTAYWPEGVYFLQIVGDNKFKVTKFAVRH